MSSSSSALQSFDTREDIHGLDRLALICNKQKHYTLNYTPRVKGATPAAAAYGVGRYGKADYSHGEQSVMIHFADGSSRNALDIVRAVAAKWSAIF